MSVGLPRIPAVTVLMVYAGLLLLIPSQFILGPLGAPGTPANLWAMAALAWWICSTVGGLGPVRGVTSIRVAAAALAVAVLAAYANGTMSGWYAPPDIRQATDELWTLVPPAPEEVAATMTSAADRGLLAAAGWLALVLVTAEGLRGWADLERLVGWVTGLGALVGTLGIIQFVTGFDVVAYIQVPGLTANSELGGVLGRSVLNRVSSTAVHPIEFGVVMACLFPLALHRTIHHWGRPLATLPTALIGVAAFMSVSRSATLCLIVVGLVLFAGWPMRWRIRALLLAPLALVALRVAVPGLVGTIVSLFASLSEDPSVSGRTSDYGVVMHLYGQHPWLGRGLFTFVPRHYRILDNQYLMILLEIGAIGLAVFLLVMVIASACAVTTIRKGPTPRNRHLGLCLLASILAWMISFATYDAWSFPMSTGIGFLCIGMAGAAARFSRAQRREARAAVASPAAEAVGA